MRLNQWLSNILGSWVKCNIKKTSEIESVGSKSFWLETVPSLLPAAPAAGMGASGELVWGRFNYSLEVSQEWARAVLGPC